MWLRTLYWLLYGVQFSCKFHWRQAYMPYIRQTTVRPELHPPYQPGHNAVGASMVSMQYVACDHLISNGQHSLRIRCPYSLCFLSIMLLMNKATVLINFVIPTREVHCSHTVTKSCLIFSMHPTILEHTVAKGHSVYLSLCHTCDLCLNSSRCRKCILDTTTEECF